MIRKLYGYVRIGDKKPKYTGVSYGDLINQAKADGRQLALVSERPSNPYSTPKFGLEPEFEVELPDLSKFER